MENAPVRNVPELAKAQEVSPEWMTKRKISWGSAIPFFLCQIAVIGVFFTGFTLPAVLLGVGLYLLRMWAITAGYHRYFSHRAYKTNRVFQFVLAFLAQTSAQKGALWWAAHHRRHHKHSDQEGDLHSPVREGFWFSHMMWMFVEGAEETDYARIKDFAKYPELVWLNKYYLVPPIMLGVACYLTLGWTGLFVGFFLSTFFTWHGTFLINSLAHVFGSRRFETTDDSRNNFLLAIITLGEGWHNNHHRYQASARNGFYWWEVDVTYYVLVALSWVGLVSDLRPVPAKILAEGRAADKAPTPSVSAPVVARVLDRAA